MQVYCPADMITHHWGGIPEWILMLWFMKCEANPFTDPVVKLEWDINYLVESKNVWMCFL